MRIFLDGDSPPTAVKEILFRTVERLKVDLILVANQPIRVPESSYISCIIVPAGPDIADDRIFEMVMKGDLAVTADIPLADRIVEKGAFVINPRGELYTKENIKNRLIVRDIAETLRGCGIETGGPSAYTQKDRKAFADQLDRFLTKYLR